MKAVVCRVLAEAWAEGLSFGGRGLLLLLLLVLPALLLLLARRGCFCTPTDQPRVGCIGGSRAYDHIYIYIYSTCNHTFSACNHGVLVVEGVLVGGTSALRGRVRSIA